MKHGRRLFGVAAGAGACVAACVAAWLSLRSAPATRPETAAEQPPLMCAPAADFTSSYELELQTELELHAHALIADPRARGQMLRSKAGFRARLRARTVERRPKATVLALELDGIAATTGSDDVSGELLSELTRPFYILLDAGCGITESGFAPDLSAEAINRLQALTSSLSLSLAQAASEWTTREHDSMGQYAARYVRAEAPQQVVKRRTAYLRAHPPLGHQFKEAMLVRILGSATKAELDGQGAWLEGLESRERLRVTRTDGSLVANLHTTLALSRLEDGARARVDMPSNLRWRRASDAPLAFEPRPAAPPDEMKTMPLEAALARYAALMRAGGSQSVARAADFLALFLRAQPSQAAALMAMLERGRVPPDLESTLFLALELAGTPESQTALIQGLSDKHAARNRARAAAALPDVPAPSEETLAALRTTAREAVAESKDDTRLVRNSASYALGALEQRVRGKNPALARDALTGLRNELEAAHQPGQLATALDAIGNSGNPDLLRDLAPFLTAKDALVRSHAIEAMSHMDPQANKQQFRALLRDERDPQVRAVIAKTYADQARRADTLAPPEVLSAAIDALPSERDPHVRGLLVDLVGPSCASDPRAVQALAELFRRETDPLLLRRIGRYVPADKLGS